MKNLKEIAKIILNNMELQIFSIRHNLFQRNVEYFLNKFMMDDSNINFIYINKFHKLIIELEKPLIIKQNGIVLFRNKIGLH